MSVVINRTTCWRVLHSLPSGKDSGWAVLSLSILTGKVGVGG